MYSFGVSRVLTSEVTFADKDGKDGTAASREEADARSVFVGNVNISFLCSGAY